MAGLLVYEASWPSLPGTGCQLKGEVKILLGNFKVGYWLQLTVCEIYTWSPITPCDVVKIVQTSSSTVYTL